MSAAIILTHNRHDMVKRTANQISTQVDEVFIIDNASNPPVQSEHSVIYVPDQPPNLARFWNMGFAAAVYHKYVSVLCDDAIVPDGWFEAVTKAMDHFDATIGCSNALPSGRVSYKTQPDNNIGERLCGWAFVIRNDRNLRADESMHWWFFDTDLDWQARQNGGVVIINTHTVHNEMPNHYTVTKPELTDRAAKDRLVFANKWGYAPW